MSRQTDLFCEQPPPIRDPRVTDIEKPRLNRQAIKILERLRHGESTNSELARIAIRYSARIHDLRRAGYRIEIISRDRESGLNVYALMEDVR